jgi:nuclease-like protein
VVATVAASLTGIVMVVGLFRLPVDSLVWSKGIEGERRAADYLAPVIAADYIVLYNRLIPGLGGDVDSVVIGPTGIFAIETKNWSGKLEVLNNRLYVGNSNRTWAIDQLYREAIAVQIALAPELNRARVTVTPVLCAIGGVASSEREASGVHITNGKRLSRFILERPSVFDDPTVRRIVELAERELRRQYIWEVRTGGRQ